MSAAVEIQTREDGPPPKRRRIAAPAKSRTTANIDLANHCEHDGDGLERLISALRKKKKIVVIAGASISVSAGIPDFRSSTGLFAIFGGQHKLQASGKHLFDASVYKHDSSTQSFYRMVCELAQMTSDAKPTPFHYMLVSLASEGRLMRLYTQNIDSLDTRMPPLTTAIPLNAKGPWPTTIQLHGGLENMEYTERDRVRTISGKQSCGIGRLRPRIVLYNECNPDAEAIGKVSEADLRNVPDAVIVVGTSLKIPGVRTLINLDPKPQGSEFENYWDFIVYGRCDDVANLVNLPR
ncbi:DHS-like NAD/FAD-binding domain-containing protein [Parachaetomium inaequale]|uniref:DHS-like NAD/FAD-binding domain-containing protein n=1 Tax=Parachaetomium inaequale TaxID=2588326 RepID=A0AAN6P4E0_9PEZI|nr:DHS-like NAD/FAD-binding domain-containing protein [Parachaetomium inaequale]